MRQKIQGTVSGTQHFRPGWGFCQRQVVGGARKIPVARRRDSRGGQENREGGVRLWAESIGRNRPERSRPETTGDENPRRFRNGTVGERPRGRSDGEGFV